MAEKLKTNIWGPLTRDLLKVFQKFCDDENHLHISKLRPACNSLDLYPSSSQVHEMLMCAIDYGSPCKPDHITVGEFCILVSELQSNYAVNPKSPVPLSLVKHKPEIVTRNRKRRESFAHFQVFLGGSCNPTQWRAEKAIPYFKEHGITFYNPQVQNWKPELMELEAQAKQMADVLFFVIDNKTRAISSMIEVGYLVATKRQVVVTMCEFQESKVCINGDAVTESELHDLLKGRHILTDLIERNSVPIFTDIHKALHCTQLVLKQHKHVQDLTVTDGAQQVKHGHLKLGQALLELRESFNSMDTARQGFLSKSDMCLAYKCCTGDELDPKWLRQRRKSQDQFMYEEFCTMCTEYREQGQTYSFLQRVLSHITVPFRWILNKLSSPVEDVIVEDRSSQRDIYLGGSGGKFTWRSDVVIPLLRKHGISYVDPDVHQWDQKLIPIHVALREQCRLLLYVIANDRRSLSSMCEAGYYIGMGCRIIVCVQKLPRDSFIDDETLSPCSIKDYNRGRDYLSDLASREGVPLFDDVNEAAIHAISLLTDSARGSFV